MWSFIIAMIMFASYDFIAAFGFKKQVPGINIPNDLRSKYFWKYQFVRFAIVTALFVSLCKIIEL